jgi:hypothetical protein
MILKVGLNISLSPRYWLGKYLVLSDMLFGLGTSSSLLSLVHHSPLLIVRLILIERHPRPAFYVTPLSPVGC